MQAGNPSILGQGETTMERSDLMIEIGRPQSGERDGDPEEGMGKPHGVKGDSNVDE